MTTTTTVSWLALVQAADEKFDEEKRTPVVYRMSNGTEFKDRPDPYAGTSTGP